MLQNQAKSIIKRVLKFFGKRITNYYAPAKPYLDGVAFLKDIGFIPDWIVDVGVAEGTPELHKSFPIGEYKYMLVEADPRYHDALESFQAKYQGDVLLEKCFCGEVEGEVNFFKNADGRSSSRYAERSSLGLLNVPMRTLDSLAIKNDLKGKVLLKIDVEGAELDVLRGAVGTLPLCDFVILESWINITDKGLSKSNFAALVSFMESNSFEVFDFFGGHSYSNGVLKMIDIVFKRKDVEFL